MVSLDPFIPKVGEKPFRMEKFEMEHHSFKDLVHVNWTLNDLSLSDCAENFKSVVKLWSRATFDNLMIKKREISARLFGIQRALQFKSSTFLAQLEKELTREYQLILKHEEDMWFLKSRT
ncbi:hypothetical protein SLA2020_046570 [Shorea laevis]